jgi:hypothetical protein
VPPVKLAEFEAVVHDYSFDFLTLRTDADLHLAAHQRVIVKLYAIEAGAE